MATVFLPNTFVAGTPAVATEVNQNFTAITDQVNGNLDADNLADSAVTAAKLATDAVTSSKIADSQVTNIKVASGIDATKIADGSVSNSEFQYLSGVTSDIQTQINTLSGRNLTYGARITAGTPPSINGPTGWTVTRTDTGKYTVTHGLGTASYGVSGAVYMDASPNTKLIQIGAINSNSVSFRIVSDISGSLAYVDQPFTFVLSLYE
jgi:hypothetical protein